MPNDLKYIQAIFFLLILTDWLCLRVAQTPNVEIWRLLWLMTTTDRRITLPLRMRTG